VFRSDECFEPAVETLPRADLVALQEERLRELVPLAYEGAPLIRKTWEEAGIRPQDVRTLADFTERAPFISKDAIRGFRERYGDPFGGIGCAGTDRLTFFGSTGGTTGEVALFPERWERWATMAVLMARDMWMGGARPGDHVVFPGSTRRGPSYQMFQLCGAIPLLLNGLSSELDRLIEVSRTYRPTMLYALHMPLVIALDQISGSVDLHEVFSSYRGVVFAGEPLGRRLRAKVASWGLPLFIHTSAGDVGGSTECGAHDGCHLWEDKVLAEHLVSEGDAPAADGTVGELVTSSLDHGASVLLRFRSEDLVRLTRQPCACGRTHARQWPVGRKGDEVVVDGRSILPIDVWGAIEEVPETERALFQIIRPQRHMDTLRIRVGYDASMTKSVTDVADQLKANIIAAVGVVPRLELVEQEHLLSGANRKGARVVQA
jgi:phenylacetate-CoA ligase